MKLKDIICHLSMFDKVRIYTEDSDPNIEFEGGVSDVPWIYLDYELDTTNEYEAIGIAPEVNERGVNIYYFTIYLKTSE